MNAKLCLAALVALAHTGCHRGETQDTAEAPTGPVPVHCEAATSAALHDAHTVRGSVVTPPDRDAVVSPQIPGRILHVFVHEGDAVRLDQPLAQIESQSARDALVQAQAQLAQANAQAHNAVLASARAQHLFERGIAARQEADDADARRLEGAAGVTLARATVDNAARTVARATVRSPLAGVVVRVMRREGELVDGTPATSVMEIADPSVEELLANATPADIVQLRTGQHADVHFDALPGAVFTATIRSVSPAIDPSTGVGAVRLALDTATTRPPLGLFGTASITTAEHTGLVVPATGLRGAGAQTEVVVCDDGHARVHTVVTGTRDGDRIEILRGIAAGDRVVTDHALGLEDGASIREGAR